MKRNILLLSALFLSLAFQAQNGAYIEFKIASSKGPTGTVKVLFSEYGSVSEFNMAVPQMPGGGISNKMLTKNSTPELMYSINDKTKSYSEIKVSDAAKEDHKTYTVKKLGDETINGYKCTHAMIMEGNETHEVWNTKDIPDFEKYAATFKANKRMSTQKREQALKDAGCDGLPVKTIHKGNSQEGDMTMDLVKLEKKSFSKSDFEIPAGYTKGSGGMAPQTQMKSQQEIMSMTPEERAKYIEEMKKQYGK